MSDETIAAAGRMGSWNEREGRWSEPAKQDEAPTHYETRGWKGDTPGSCGVECACGLGYDGFNSLAEAQQLLAVHIAASQPEPAPIHLTFLLGDTACGILPEQIPADDGQTVHAEVVTCPACREVLAPAT